METFKDHFSQVAGAYASWRPTYPDALFQAIRAVVPARASVWEPGCGSGQATHGLAKRFAHVLATDPSAGQLAQHWAASAAAATGKIQLAVEPAETTSLGGHSVDVVAVAQALHWFDRPRFFAECERVLRPGGVLAAWTYQDLEFPADLLPAADAFRAQIEAHWPPERADVDAGYAAYAWPFPALPSPALQLAADWNLSQLLGYLGSLSATARCKAGSGRDPVETHADALTAAWGEPARLRAMRWPLVLHLAPEGLVGGTRLAPAGRWNVVSGCRLGWRC